MKIGAPLNTGMNKIQLQNINVTKSPVNENKKENLFAYDPGFINFDNMGNNREINQSINSNMITEFNKRFTKPTKNKIIYDVDITGNSLNNEW